MTSRAEWTPTESMGMSPVLSVPVYWFLLGKEGPFQLLQIILSTFLLFFHFGNLQMLWFLGVIWTERNTVENCTRACIQFPHFKPSFQKSPISSKIRTTLTHQSCDFLYKAVKKWCQTGLRNKKKIQNLPGWKMCSFPEKSFRFFSKDQITQLSAAFIFYFSCNIQHL